MTLGEMLTLDYLDMDLFEHAKFESCKTEDEILDRVHRYQRVFKQRWFVTDNPDLVKKNGYVANLPEGISPRQALNWSGFYLVEAWDACSNLLYLEQTIRALTELGWEMIPSRYYDMEVDRPE